ncbi:MAG: type II toxin-antitoxin system RelE/ParE family toxin [bacterium]|nr:type II toxin-antitoxin system RelE/ParE family toxin [bacterium]
MKKHVVYLTDDALKDVEEIFDYITDHDTPEKATHVLNQLEKTFDSLRTSPARGAIPTELLDLGMHDYREVFFKPYRVIYKVLSEGVYIYLVVDGRRDLQALLQRRLLGA